MTPSTFDFRLSTLLSLDTATDRPTLALGSPGSPGADVPIADRHDLSRDIDRVARELLATRGVSARELAGVVVADGPGSFTGLRIGIAFAKGLCRVLGVPLLSAPSMLGAAASSHLPPPASRPLVPPDPRLVVAEYDALRGDVYRAIYRFGAAGVEVVAAPLLAHAGTDASGGALRAFERDASAAALLALVGAPGGPVPVAQPGTWEPSYGRPAEAEARRLARNAER